MAGRLKIEGEQRVQPVELNLTKFDPMDPIDILLGSVAARNIIWQWWITRRVDGGLMMVIGFTSSGEKLIIKMRKNSDGTMSAITTSRRGGYTSRTWVTERFEAHELLGAHQGVLN